MPLLTEPEATAQLQGILDAPPERRLADTIHARSEGNPLFVEELASAAIGDSPDRLPRTLRDMLLARIEALGTFAQDVVRAAAVGGRRIHHVVLADVVEQDDPRLTASVREAVRGHVLVADGDDLTFRHGLMQEVAYGELLPGERARLHAGCAQALERRPELAGGTAATLAAEIAHHWWQAGDRPRAFEAAIRAGREAEAVPAPAEAAAHFARALDLWDAVPDAEQRADLDRVELLGRAAEAAAWSGAVERADELVTRALTLVDELRDPARAGRLHGRRGWYRWFQNLPEDGVAEYEEAVRLIPREPPSVERAHALAGLAMLLVDVGRSAESRDVCEEALAVARAAGAPVAEARALTVQGIHLVMRGVPQESGGCLRQALALARESEDPEMAAQTAAVLSDALRRDGRLDEAMALALEAVEDCHRAGLDLVHGSFNALNAAEAAFELGRWDATDRLARDALGDGSTEVTMRFAHHLCGLLATARGEFEAACDHLAAEQRLSRAQPDLEGQCHLLELEAELAVWAGRPDDAARIAETTVQLPAAIEDPPMAARIIAIGVRAEADRAELARAARRASDARGAGQRARVLRDASHTGTAANQALAATIDAEVARADASSAAGLWEAAARAWDARGSPFPAAYARWRRAEALLAEPDGRHMAADELRAAWETAVRLGARPLLAEIEGLARRARVELAVADEPPHVAARPNAARDLGLTSRELEVLEHVALGQTNREIGAELFISTRTAGVHVSHILQKLGASTRTEAATAAHRLGLVP